MSPLAIYVHIPFCPSKCGYCDFNSYAMEGQIIEDTVKAICLEISSSPWKGVPAKTVFFGGGTPTFLSGDHLAQILETLSKIHPISSDIEITSEANPGTVDISKFSQMKASGFNRISLGAQSFHTHELFQLGRSHGSTHIARAVSAAKQAGFKSINLDLMFALPGQSLKSWEKNLDQALLLKPSHLSLYCLTIEPNTRFYRLHHRGMLDLPNDESQVKMYDLALEKTNAQGYFQYEISNFSQPGHECQHNLCYWRGENYLAYGPGAVGCIDWGEQRIRYTNVKHPVSYCQKVFSNKSLWCDQEEISLKDQQFEQLMLGIRLNQGFSLEKTNLKNISRLMEKGWIEIDQDKLFLSSKGRHFCNEVVLELSL